MKHVSLLAAAAGLAFAAPASAELYTFTITGDYSATFTLDSSPTPDVVDENRYFTMWDVPGFSDAILGVADVSFFVSEYGGGFQIDDFYSGTTLLTTDGPQLYFGGEETPTFLTGTFDLTEYTGSGVYSLTIASLAGSVPEPASWAMMIAGFGLIGGAMRRRQTLTVAYQTI